MAGAAAVVPAGAAAGAPLVEALGAAATAVPDADALGAEAALADALALAFADADALGAAVALGFGCAGCASALGWANTNAPAAKAADPSSSQPACGRRISTFPFRQTNENRADRRRGVAGCVTLAPPTGEAKAIHSEPSNAPSSLNGGRGGCNDTLNRTAVAACTTIAYINLRQVRKRPDSLDFGHPSLRDVEHGTPGRESRTQLVAATGPAWRRARACARGGEAHPI